MNKELKPANLDTLKNGFNLIFLTILYMYNVITVIPPPLINQHFQVFFFQDSLSLGSEFGAIHWSLVGTQ